MHPSPRMPSAASLRSRARRNSLLAPGATGVLNAYPSAISWVNNDICQVILRSHLDQPVNEDSALPIRNHHYRAPTDLPGDHAST